MDVLNWKISFNNEIKWASSNNENGHFLLNFGRNDVFSIIIHS